MSVSPHHISFHQTLGACGLRDRGCDFYGQNVANLQTMSPEKLVRSTFAISETANLLQLGQIFDISNLRDRGSQDFIWGGTLYQCHAITFLSIRHFGRADRGTADIALLD